MARPTENPVAVAVLGAGSWGTALAILLARNGHDVRLWGPEHELRPLRSDGENRRYLPGIAFPPGLRPLPELDEALAGTDEALLVVPSHAFRSVTGKVAESKSPPTSLSWATKGFDPDTGMLLSEVAEELLPGCSLAVLSGPTFAAEVARGLPTAITVASADEHHAARLADYLHSPGFRAYTSTDVRGVQVGGATKNVMAIAAGISDGLGFGANARAALITRGWPRSHVSGLRSGDNPKPSWASPGSEIWP